MRSMNALAGAVIFVAGTAAGAVWCAQLDAQGASVAADCEPVSVSQVRTTLYFGLQRPKGSVSELEWQIFLRDEVTKQFPDGLTVWEADGQWRTPAGTIAHERSKVLLLVHADTAAARKAVQSVIEAYRRAFEQQSVFWERSRVCVAS